MQKRAPVTDKRSSGVHLDLESILIDRCTRSSSVGTTARCLRSGAFKTFSAHSHVAAETDHRIARAKK
jgi:hypothetical protein